MSNITILIVEDQNIVAKDIQMTLLSLGYKSPAIVSSGEEAIEKAKEIKPNLILMDIKLNGKIDGIQAANEINKTLKTPIIYITAYADHKTLKRAKITEPFGYILKPFQEQDLQTTIEMALYKNKMENKLKEKEEWLSTTLKSIQDGVVTTDIKGNITFINKTAEIITGWESNHIIGKNITEKLNLINNKTRNTIKINIEDILHNNIEQNVLNDLTLITDNNVEVPIEKSMAPIIDNEKKTSGVVFVLRDITERKKMETELRQSHKMEAIGRLAGGIAHDFNNLLTAIIGYSDLLIYDTDAYNPLYEGIEQIKKAAERAASLTKQLLAFSRRQMILPRIISVNNIISEMQKLLHRIIGEDIELITNLDENINLILADAGQIQQVIMNLVINARDAMPKGGKISITTKNLELKNKKSIGDTYINPGSYVTINVKDSGIGMDQNTIEHLFEPFFTKKPLGKGTGLGLSTVYGIIMQNKGHISVESNIENGSSFIVYLPKINKNEINEIKKSEQKIIHKGTETILLVEDELMVRSLSKTILMKNGYTVIEASHGEEALSLIKQYNKTKIHLLITDIIMPGIDGHELANELIKKHTDIKVLFMSGYPEKDLVEDPVISPGSPFLQKPFTPIELLDKVRLILKQKKN